MINIFKSIKLMKYSNGCISNLLIYLSFTGFGIYLMLTTEYTPLSCAFLMLGPCMLSNIFINLSEHESVATSQLSHTLKRTIPNIILIVSSIFALAFLSIISYLRCDVTSSFYSVYTEYDLNAIYVSGLWIILLAVVVYPILSTNILKGIVAMIIVSIPAYLINYLFVRWNDSLYEEYFLTPLSYNTLLYIGIVVFIIAMIVTLGFKPFAASVENAKKWKSIRKYVFALGIVAVIVFVAINIYINRKSPTVDGIYHYSKLIDEYEKLASNCESNPQTCNNSNGCLINTQVTIDIVECYYNTDTFDAYCKFTITLPNHSIDSVYIENNVIHVSSVDMYNDIYITCNCNSIMDLEYKVSNTKPNVAEVKLIINGIPDSRKIFDARTLNLTCCHIVVNFPKHMASDTYKDDEKNIFVSSTSLIHTGSKPATDIVIKKKNGKDEVIMSDGILANGVEKYQNNAITKYIFYNTIDPNEIEEVVMEDNEDAFKPDYNNTFILTENSHLRKIIYFEDRGTTIVIEWLQEPENKYTDYIKIGWNDADVDMASAEVSLKAKKTSDGEWISKSFSCPYETISTESGYRYKSYEYFDSLHYSKVEPDMFYINEIRANNEITANNSAVIFSKFFEDTSSETYTNHTLTIVFDMDYSGGKPDTFPIYCDYYHMLTDITTDSKEEVILDNILKSTKCGKVGRYFGAY